MPHSRCLAQAITPAPAEKRCTVVTAHTQDVLYAGVVWRLSASWVVADEDTKDECVGVEQHVLRWIHQQSAARDVGCGIS